MRLSLTSPTRGTPWAPKALFGSGRQAQSPRPLVDDAPLRTPAWHRCTKHNLTTLLRPRGKACGLTPASNEAGNQRTKSVSCPCTYTCGTSMNGRMELSAVECVTRQGVLPHATIKKDLSRLTGGPLNPSRFPSVVERVRPRHESGGFILMRQSRRGVPGCGYVCPVRKRQGTAQRVRASLLRPGRRSGRRSGHGIVGQKPCDTVMPEHAQHLPNPNLGRATIPSGPVAPLPVNQGNDWGCVSFLQTWPPGQGLSLRRNSRGPLCMRVLCSGEAGIEPAPMQTNTQWEGGGFGGGGGANYISFGSTARREADSQPISQLARPALSQTEKHSLGVLSVADAAPSSGANSWLRASNGRMVMQLTANFLVGGSNPGRANMAVAPPTTVDRPGFEPPT